ncbi:MAG: AsnC family transcriptional regulator [Candidatus Bathyarchaeota archaeon]|nr:AsnC family transcriptional regulator [Candidatus Bathyarchaeota archaeon]MDH5595546.1 AsnC family transcriptional regulator [Candidatus Bathyarchaeota archaeon]
MSRLEDYEWMLQYFKMLNPINAKILEGLGKYGPRNVLALAKSIGLPPRTVTFRIRKLMKEGLLQIRTNLDYTRLGLMKAVLIAESKPGQEKKLQQVIDNLDYWTYVVRCYGKYDGYYTIFAFPAEYKKELEEYLDEAAQLKTFSRYIFHHTTNFTEVVPNFDWFDFQSKSWNFQWRSWIDAVQNASEKLPRELVEPKTYSIRVDEIDLLILKELEKDGTTKFTKLAEMVNITPQGVRYRYHKHIVGRGLLTDYEVATLPYPLPTSEMCGFKIDFENEEKLAKFTNSLQNKPFIFNYGKAIGQHSLVVHAYIPKTEFSKLIDLMNRLTEKKLITGFLYVTFDVASFKRQTISYEFFKENKWTYDYKKKLERLKEVTCK